MKQTTFLKRRSNWDLHKLIHQCKQNFNKGKNSDKHYYHTLIIKYENELVERLKNKPINR